MKCRVLYGAARYCAAASLRGVQKLHFSKIVLQGKGEIQGVSPLRHAIKLRGCGRDDVHLWWGRTIFSSCWTGTKSALKLASARSAVDYRMEPLGRSQVQSMGSELSWPLQGVRVSSTLSCSIVFPAL